MIAGSTDAAISVGQFIIRQDAGLAVADLAGAHLCLGVTASHSRTAERLTEVVGINGFAASMEPPTSATRTATTATREPGDEGICDHVGLILILRRSNYSAYAT